MQRNIKDALERVERAQAYSKQPRFTPLDRSKMFSSIYKWIKSQSTTEPSYQADSRVRDKWLSEIWMKEPHIAGVINTVVSIDRNRNWTLLGGKNLVNKYAAILRDSEEGEGWRYFAGRAALSFYTSDLGAVTEVGRDGEGGPTRALYNVDPTQCYLTGKRETPLSYTPVDHKEQLWKPDDYFRTTPLPTVRESLRGLGYCGLSRSWAYVQMMMAVYEHDMEQLGAKAPKGLLLLQNINEQQWIDAMKSREINLSQLERDYYGGIAVLAQEGVDEIDAKLVALSQLPAGFDLDTVIKLCMLGIALSFGYDPIEFWAVSTGALGRSRESEIQHMKATGKGGIEFSRTFQDRLQGELPSNILFEFEQRDVTGELADAQVQKAWAEVFTLLYGNGTGVVTLDEVRQLMARQGIIPAEWTPAEEEAQAGSTGEQRSWQNSEAVWRSVFANPHEAIVEYKYGTNSVHQLAQSGFDMVRKHHDLPVAYSVYDSMYENCSRVERSNLLEFESVFRQPKVYLIAQRADDDLLYDDDDLTISLEDVQKAINAGKKRVSNQFSELLLAEPEEN